MRPLKAGLIFAFTCTLAPTALAGMANEFLSAKSASDRAQYLTAVTASQGYACPSVSKVLFSGEQDGEDWFSISCSNGDDYMVAIRNSKQLEPRVIRCSRLERYETKCWSKW